MGFQERVAALETIIGCFESRIKGVSISETGRLQRAPACRIPARPAPSASVTIAPTAVGPSSAAPSGAEPARQPVSAALDGNLRAGLGSGRTGPRPRASTRRSGPKLKYKQRFTIACDIVVPIVTERGRAETGNTERSASFHHARLSPVDWRLMANR